jgi:hypothetical protein
MQEIARSGTELLQGEWGFKHILCCLCGTDFRGIITVYRAWEHYISGKYWANKNANLAHLLKESFLHSKKMGWKNVTLLYEKEVFWNSETRDLSGGPKGTVSWSYFLPKCFVGRALSLSRFGHVTACGEWLSPTLGTWRIQGTAGALLSVLLNTLPTVHELFVALLSYKWLLSLFVALDCWSSHGSQEFCWVGECNCDLDSTPKAVCWR